MAANVFKTGKMISNVVDSYLANAVSEVAIPDGAIVKLGDLAADTTYAANGKEYDTYVATAPAAANDEVVICDYAGIEEYSESGYTPNNTIKYGIKLYGLTVPAGTIYRVRRLALHDKFWLGEANFTAGKAPAAGKFAAPAAGVTTLSVADTLSGTGMRIKILVEEDLTTGMKSDGKIYLCEVVQL